MSETSLENFLNPVKIRQQFWALHDLETESWVIVDSLNFADTDVILLWSTKELASSNCVDEWQNYIPKAISVSDWLEYWAEDLAPDGVIVGINGDDNNDPFEMDLADFCKEIADLENLLG